METGVDVGGTFTDVVAWDGVRLVTGKVPTTGDQADGVLRGIASLVGRGGSLRHGTTAATNALLERRGARTALVADRGFEDLIEIGRQDRPSLYDTSAVRAVPLADRTARFGALGRGEWVGAADPGVLDELVDKVAAVGAEAVAVSLLFSFADDEAERAVGGALRAAMPDIPVSLSSQVAPEFREFERTSTTLVNAYLMPEVARYLTTLRQRAGDVGVEGTVAVMRSSGGLMPLEEAAGLPAAILLSGPAGGVVAAAELGRALGLEHLVSFDMGGTSTDVCRIDAGRPDVAYERSIDGLPCRMPSVAVHTVGAGGGSLGWVDTGGALRVGPQSAGADPGPACYGRGGTQAAVTDANLFLGRIAAGTELGGGLVLDGEAAVRALRRLGDAAGIDAEAAALGILVVVEEHMHRAIRAVSVEQGADPRRAHLVAFGGAGGLHATALARRLDMAGVVVPAHAGVFSALGLLLAPPRADAARSVLLGSDDGARLEAAVGEVSEAARRALGRSGREAEEVRTLADVRYLGQSHETTVPYGVGEGIAVLADRFHAAHRERNGFARPGDPIEIVTVRAEAMARPALRWDELPAPEPVGVEFRGSREMRTREGVVEAAVWWRPALRPETEVIGPAIVEEPEATTVLFSGERAVVTEGGALEVSW
jgi:N-methylhydantoinase A